MPARGLHRKNMGSLVFGQAKNDCNGGLGIWSPLTLQRVQGDTLVGRSPQNFFCIKHAKTVIIRMNIG